MKYLRQLLMILIFSFIGEVLHAVIPIQMPASIYGCLLYTSYECDHGQTASGTQHAAAGTKADYYRFPGV